MSAGASIDGHSPALPSAAAVPDAVGSRDLHAGVPVPAPFYFAAALVLAWPLHLHWPLTLVRGPAADVVGASLCFVVAVMSALGVRSLRRAGTSIRPDRPVAALVTGGPFRFSRNPIYLSLGLLSISLGVWTRNAWIIVLLPPTLAVVNRLVIAREERYLGERFGEPYRRYRERVRRWI